MTHPGSLKCVAVILTVLLIGGSLSAYAQTAESNVPPGIQIAKHLGRADLSKEIKIIVYLKLNNKAAFDRAVDALYDPTSPTQGQWMTNKELQRYGATEEQQRIVRAELEHQGLKILSTDPTGFTISASGTIANVEKAFNTEIHNFEYNGKVFRSNVQNARLSGVAGDYVSTVAGLESHQVWPMAMRALDPKQHPVYPSVALSKLAPDSFPALSTTNCLSAPTTYNLQTANGSTSAVYAGTVFSDNPVCDYLPSQLQDVLGLKDVYAAGFDGAGQTIVLVEAFGYPTLQKDANVFFRMANLPLLNSSNFSVVYPEGKPSNPREGILTGWDVEMALDLDWAHVVAPGAKIVEVVTNGQDSEDFQHSILYVAEHDLGNSVSNSYEEDVDIIAGPLEQTSWDAAIEVAAAKGISVNFSTGDSGDHGLGTPLGAAGVPSVAPHATAVGGTTILNDVNNPGSTITTSWGNWTGALAGLDKNKKVVLFDPPTQFYLNFGGGGGGESVFWTKPTWQMSLPGKGRQTPDVSALSNPWTGVPIVDSFGGTVPFLSYGWGGTSLGCPIFSAFWALANQKAGHPLGQAAPRIARLPYGGVQDVLANNDSTPNNLAGTITDQSGTTSYSASQLFGPVLERNRGFTATIWPFPTNFTWLIIVFNSNGTQATYTVNVIGFAFGLDTSLTVRKGWDNATGWGTPYGLAFLDAVTR